MSERPTTIGPRVNMGGTCGQDLLDAYCAAMDALDAAAWAVAMTTPILRDYQPDTNLWRIAMNLHEARLAQLKRMKADIEAIAEYVIAHGASLRSVARQMAQAGHRVSHLGVLTTQADAGRQVAGGAG